MMSIYTVTYQTRWGMVYKIPVLATSVENVTARLMSYLTGIIILSIEVMQ